MAGTSCAACPRRFLPGKFPPFSAATARENPRRSKPSAASAAHTEGKSSSSASRWRNTAQRSCSAAASPCCRRTRKSLFVKKTGAGRPRGDDRSTPEKSQARYGGDALRRSRGCSSATPTISPAASSSARRSRKVLLHRARSSCCSTSRQRALTASSRRQLAAILAAI